MEDGDGPVNASKFSGKPWLSRDMEWPVCPKCNKPMRFFVQLSLADLPKDLKEDFGTGLLQMFHCMNEECRHDAVCPFAKSVLVRIIQPDEEGKDVELPDAQDLFPPKLITGWESCDDYPHQEEEVEVDLRLNDDEWNILHDLNLTGDKLWGWPAWVQSMQYPPCPACGRQMRLVFQIDSEDNLPVIFGDCDRGWITQCPEHKEQLTFHFDST